MNALLRPFHPRPPPSPVAVVDPTQAELAPSQLELEEPSAGPLIGGGASRSPSEDAGKMRQERGQTTAAATTTTAAAAAVAANEMVLRAVGEAVALEEMGTQEGAEAALVVSGRLLAENPLSAEPLHLKGLALHLLGRYVEVMLWGSQE